MMLTVSDQKAALFALPTCLHTRFLIAAFKPGKHDEVDQFIATLKPTEESDTDSSESDDYWDSYEVRNSPAAWYTDVKTLTSAIVFLALLSRLQDGSLILRIKTIDFSRKRKKGLLFSALHDHRYLSPPPDKFAACCGHNWFQNRT